MHSHKYVCYYDGFPAYPVFRIIYQQEAMENFVFPDENKQKLMNIFPIFTGIPQQSYKRSFFIYTGKTVKKAFMFWTGVQRQMHKSKKA